jgi:flagellar protein FliS
MYANPYEQYRNAQIETASPDRLLLMLYDGAIRFLGQAREALSHNEIEKANHLINRVQDIIAELMSTLNFEVGEVSHNLFRLYEYMNYRLVEANLKKDPAPTEEVERMLRDLREAWQQAAQMARVGSSKVIAAG